MQRRDAPNRLRLGTRGSRLARTQTAWVAERLRRCHPELQVVEVVIATKGDRDPTTPLARMGGDGLFVKELESALLDGRVDAAVHSLKDLPTADTDGLVLGAVPERAPAGDLFVSRRYPTLEACPPGTRIGTGSARRRVQLRWAAPAVDLVDIRGNVDTRLARVRDDTVDAVVIAEAGLVRLGVACAAGLQVQPLGTDVMLPAAGQGALAVQIRRSDGVTAALVAAIDHPSTAACVTAERAFLAAVGGGCHHPIAALARRTSQRLTLEAVVARDETAFLVRLKDSVPVTVSPTDLGRKLADEGRRWLGSVETEA